MRVTRRAALALAIAALLAGCSSSEPPASVPSRTPAVSEGSEPNPTDREGDSAETAPLVVERMEWPDGRSQTDEAAARDGVLPEVAALAISDRVGVVDVVATGEGIWLTSRMPCGVEPCVGDASLLLGDRDGTYGIDYVNKHEYGELLLLDHETLEIVRAWPLPGMPPNGANFNDQLTVTSDAIYFAHQGDGGLPKSYVMRVERQTLEAKVRIVSVGLGQSAGDQHLLFDYWTVTDAELDRSIQHGLVATDEIVVTIGYRGEVVVRDPDTLEPITEHATGRTLLAGPRGTLAKVKADHRLEGFVHPRDLSADHSLPAPDVRRRLRDVVDTPSGPALLMDWLVAVWSENAATWTTIELPSPSPRSEARIHAVGDDVFVAHGDTILRVPTGPDASKIQPAVVAILEGPSRWRIPAAVIAGPRPGSAMAFRGSEIVRFLWSD